MICIQVDVRELDKRELRTVLLWGRLKCEVEFVFGYAAVPGSARGIVTGDADKDEIPF